MHEHFSRKKYTSPLHYHGGQVTHPVMGINQNTTVTCEFTRQTRPNDGVHTDIDVDRFQPMLWAFNPRSGLNYEGSWFTYHGKEHRGAATADLLRGGIVGEATKSITKKQLHGFGMMAVWLFLFPFAIFYARYLRSTSGWNFIHMVIQISGIVAIVVFFVVILTDWINLTRPHSILGLVLIGFIVLQLVLGICNLLGLSNESLSRIRYWIRGSHKWLGAALVVTSVAQIGLGLDTVYPWIEKDRGRPAWGVYIFLILFWAIAFLATEIYFWKSVRRTAPLHRTQQISNDGKPVVAYSKVKRGGTTMTLVDGESSSVIPLDTTRLRPDLKQYTWETLGEAIENGELLVVANGRYVYSIAQWMTSHPGGQLILHAVNGTDITNDYFHEAGFDAEEFVPRPAAPAQRANRAQVTLPRRAPSSIAQSDVTSTAFGGASLIQDMKIAPLMAEQDWKIVVRSRRTHVHTRLAIQKLSNLIVGELVPDDAAAVMNGGQRPFDPQEYRRYALVENSPVSPATPHIHKLRFCLLYPYDTRANEPTTFYPGQSIQLQMRINSKIVTRYYSPLVGGNLSVFEVLIKIYPGGAMTQFLSGQKPGNRQYKIRGPFGTPIVHPGRPLTLASPHRWIPKNILFFAGGSGITPFLQLLSTILMPIHEPLRVIVDYNPQLEDELELVRGDRVVIKHHYYDGWAIGINLRTGMEGAFPLTVTAPRCDLKTKITLVHAIENPAETAIGHELIEGAVLAYPSIIQVHRFISGGGAAPGDISQVGIVYNSRLTGPNLQHILRSRFGYGQYEDEQHYGEEHEDDGEGYNKKVYICGPRGFDSWIVDCLEELGGVDVGRSVVILPSDRVV